MDAPERILAWSYSDPWGNELRWFAAPGDFTPDGSETEYIRADIHAAALDRLARLEAESARLDRECKLAEAQVDRLLALSTSMDADFAKFVEAVQALGAMPEGYCFCSKDRIGDDSKEHEPECADLRALLMDGRHDRV